MGSSCSVPLNTAQMTSTTAANIPSTSSVEVTTAVMASSDQVTDASNSAPATDVSNSAPATDVSNSAPATDLSNSAPAIDVSNSDPETDVSNSALSTVQDSKISSAAVTTAVMASSDQVTDASNSAPATDASNSALTTVEDAFAGGETDGTKVGQRTILPAAITAVPRRMREKYSDGTAQVDRMTHAVPVIPEIGTQESIPEGESATGSRGTQESIPEGESATGSREEIPRALDNEESPLLPHITPPLMPPPPTNSSVMIAAIPYLFWGSLFLISATGVYYGATRLDEVLSEFVAEVKKARESLAAAKESWIAAGCPPLFTITPNVIWLGRK